jgi:hypothetical protein
MTAVEFLEEQYNLMGMVTQLQIEQAKEMERELAFEFWQGGIKCTEEGGKSFDQYYNEKYKKD